MSYVSTVFRAMLSERFKEGTELASHSAVEIPWPDDDPIIMLMLCHILHMLQDMISMQPEAMQLLDLANTCDEYDCARAVKPSVAAWAMGILQHADSTDRKIMLAAACRLHNEALMDRLAVDMLLYSSRRSTFLTRLGMASGRISLVSPKIYRCHARLTQTRRD